VYDHNWCSVACPIYEGMQFAAAHHTNVAMQLFALWGVVSLAAQSILGCLPIDTFQVGVVGEMVARFQERAEWCSHLEASDSSVGDLFLWPADGRAHLVTCLEEAATQIGVMQDEIQTLQMFFCVQSLDIYIFYRFL
jgi:hypothetical protein